ncbi:MAG: flagellar biosynthesis protein FlhB [Thermosulfidibacteraceae bacterium]|jgi:flagellar biosynthetic protein FlhB
MFERDDAERTEEATPRKREEARKKGQVPKSRELSTAILLFSVLLFFYLFRDYYLGAFKSVFIHHLRLLGRNYTPNEVILGFLYSLGRFMIPFFIVVLTISVLSNVIQFGVVFTLEPLIPSLDRLNPFRFLDIVLSRRTWIEVLKSLLKALLVFYVVYVFLKSELLILGGFTSYTPQVVVSQLMDLLFSISFRIALLFLVLAILDYGYQKREYESSLRMTRQEIKEELRQYEGDPLVKSRMRRIMREITKRRMLREVPKATVVITNPVELAVALKYDEKEMDAPQVVAKGAGELALRIREIAREHNVPIVENRPLARALYRLVEVGDEIPQELYRAVAEVLAYVYRLKGKVK